MVSLNDNEVESVITTLKQIDVRGFDSMDRLVALVAFFENKYNVSKAAKAVEEKDNGIS